MEKEIDRASEPIASVVILTTQSGDWEGMFIDGELISEGHHLGGNNRMFMMQMGEKYKFTSGMVREKYLDDNDDEMMETRGSFPKNIVDLKGEYI